MVERGRRLAEPDEGDTRSVPFWRSAAFLIIVIAGCFHFGRGAPVDGAVFLGVAGALILAELSGRRRPLSLRIPNAVRIATIGVAIGLGWVVGHWPPVPVAVVVGVLGPPMVWLALRAGGTGPRQATRPGWWRWAVAGVLICLWELASFLQQPDATTGSHDHPTLSVVLEPAFAANPARGLLLAGWLVAGVLLARLMLTHGRQHE